MSQYVLVEKAEIEKNKQSIEALKALLASEPSLSAKAAALAHALSPVATLEETLSQAKQVKAESDNPNRLFQNRRYPAVTLDETVIAPLYGNGKV